jgi:hypothetical protein
MKSNYVRSHYPKGVFNKTLKEAVEPYGKDPLMKRPEIQWSLLKENKCPKDGREFSASSFTTRPGYIVCECGFQINERRYSEIVTAQTNARIGEEDDDE